MKKIICCLLLISFVFNETYSWSFPGLEWFNKQRKENPKGTIAVLAAIIGTVSGYKWLKYNKKNNDGYFNFRKSKIVVMKKEEKQDKLEEQQQQQQNQQPQTELKIKELLTNNKQPEENIYVLFDRDKNLKGICANKKIDNTPVIYKDSEGTQEYIINIDSCIKQVNKNTFEQFLKDGTFEDCSKKMLISSNDIEQK